ncbi:MAG TPA: MlaD family protein [Arachidicoccus sp.]
MKISNETKIGALTIIAIVFLFLGFNFLKGKSLFKSGFYLYAKFPQSAGLVASNPVFINGFQAGSVAAVSASKDLKEILVEIKLSKDYDLPQGSSANISSNPLGSSSVEISLGNSTVYLHSGDTLITAFTPGLLGQVSSQIKPLADQAKAVMLHVDTLMENVNNILDSSSRQHIREITENLSAVTNGLIQTTSALNEALDLRSGALSAMVKHLDSFTSHLSSNGQNMDSIVLNMKTLSHNLSQADINGMMNNLKTITDTLNAMLSEVKSPNSSVGAMINSKDMYNNLMNTVNSLHILLDDLRAHPKRYINISVFGKKDKGNYLEKPLPTDSLTPSTQK